MLVAAGLMLLLQHLPLPRWLQVLIALIAILAYCAAVGMKPPVVRAGVMCAVFLGSQAVGKHPDALSSVAIAAMLYALWEPGAVLDPGFQLSFGAVFSLVLYSPYIYRKLIRNREAWRGSLTRSAARFAGVPFAVTIVAIAGSAPIAAAHFGQFSFVGPIANLVTAPVVAAMYAFNALAQVAGPISEPLSAGFDHLSGVVASWVIEANRYFGNLAWSSVEFPPISGWLCAPWYALLLLASPRERVPIKELLSASALERSGR